MEAAGAAAGGSVVGLGARSDFETRTWVRVRVLQRGEKLGPGRENLAGRVRGARARRRSRTQHLLELLTILTVLSVLIHCVTT